MATFRPLRTFRHKKKSPTPGDFEDYGDYDPYELSHPCELSDTKIHAPLRTFTHAHKNRHVKTCKITSVK